MSAPEDAQAWLDHLADCMRCPVIRCPHGDELAAAVRENLAPGTSWAGIYRPRTHEHGPAQAARNEHETPGR